MGYTISNTGVTAKPVLNVYGGELRTSYLRLCDHPSQGYVTVNVSGGILRSTGDYAGGNNTAGGTIYINVSTNGLFQCDKNFNFFKGGSGSTGIVRIFDGGTLQANNFNCDGTGTARIEADGGVIKPNGTVNARIVTALGEKGLTINARGNTTWNGAIQTLSGATRDGGLTVTGGKTVTFAGNLTFTGPITCSDSSQLLFSGKVPAGPVCALGSGILRSTVAATFPSVTNGAAATFGFTLNNGTVSTLTLNDWCPPSRLTVYFVPSGATDPVATPGTYELLKFPASVPFTASQVVPFATPAGASYTYAVETSGNVKTLKLTVAASSTPATATWTNAAGGDWQTGANWDGGNAPASGSSTVAAFTTAAQAGGATVTLDSAFTVGGVTVDSAEPYTFAGTGPLTLAGAYMPTWSTLAGSHAVTLPLGVSGPVAFNTDRGRRRRLRERRRERQRHGRALRREHVYRRVPAEERHGRRVIPRQRGRGVLHRRRAGLDARARHLPLHGAGRDDRPSALSRHRRRLPRQPEAGPRPHADGAGPNGWAAIRRRCRA